MPGDLESNKTFEHLVVSATCQEVTFERLSNPSQWRDNVDVKEKMLNGMTEALKELIEQNVTSVIANCGLFMWLHATGVLEDAVDRAMKQLVEEGGAPPRRPTVVLSSLNMLSSYLPTLGLGKEQRELHTSSTEPKSLKCRVVVFTSNGESCKHLLDSVPQLKGSLTQTVCKDSGTIKSTVIMPPKNGEKFDLDGEVLVVGLNSTDLDLIGGDCKGNCQEDVVDEHGNTVSKKVDACHGKCLAGFGAVKKGSKLDYKMVEGGIEKVAKKIKEKYPDIALVIVECTQVSTFSDVIRRVMNVSVFDPANLAKNSFDLLADHGYDMKEYIAMHLQMPPLNTMKKLVESGGGLFGGILNEKFEAVETCKNMVYGGTLVPSPDDIKWVADTTCLALTDAYHTKHRMIQLCTALLAKGLLEDHQQKKAALKRKAQESVDKKCWETAEDCQCFLDALNKEGAAAAVAAYKALNQNAIENVGSDAAAK